jgi:hypothetical protein
VAALGASIRSIAHAEHTNRNLHFTASDPDARPRPLDRESRKPQTGLEVLRTRTLACGQSREGFPSRIRSWSSSSVANQDSSRSGCSTARGPAAAGKRPTGCPDIPCADRVHQRAVQLPRDRDATRLGAWRERRSPAGCESAAPSRSARRLRSAKAPLPRATSGERATSHLANQHDEERLTERSRFVELLIAYVSVQRRIDEAAWISLHMPGSRGSVG